MLRVNTVPSHTIRHIIPFMFLTVNPTRPSIIFCRNMLHLGAFIVLFAIILFVPEDHSSLTGRIFDCCESIHHETVVLHHVLNKEFTGTPRNLSALSWIDIFRKFLSRISQFRHPLQCISHTLPLTSEFPQSFRYPCTTMPWTIWPALVVL